MHTTKLTGPMNDRPGGIMTTRAMEHGMHWIRTRQTVIAATMVLAASVLVGRPAAIQQRALPPFQVQAPDGAAAGSGQVAIAGQQVLIYVDAECGACTPLFSALVGLDAAELEATTFIVRGDRLTAAAFMGRVTATMPSVRWFIDEHGSAYTALRLETSPVVLGLRSGRIVWARPGRVGNVASLNTALRSWLGPAPATPQP